MNFPRELRTGIFLLLVASTLCLPARGLVVFNDGHDHLYVTGTVGIAYDSNVFGNNASGGDTIYSASVIAEYTRRAGWIGVNASLELDASRFGKNEGENFNNPKFTAELTKLSGRTTGSLTMNVSREDRADPNVNVRTESWNYGAGLNVKYPVIERYALAGGVGYSLVDYTDNRAYVDLRSYSANADLFYVLSQDRDLVAGYRYRKNQSSANTSSADHSFTAGVTGKLIRGYTGSVRLGYQFHAPSQRGEGSLSAWTGNATVAHGFTKKLTLTAQAGKDFSTTANNIDIDKTSGSADLQYAFNSRWNVHGGLAYGYTRFLGTAGLVPSLGRPRRDTFLNANVGAGYTRSEHFKVSLNYTWSENWSTLQFSDFIRRNWSLSVSSRW